MENHREKVARLRWACRRGMLELDILLLTFLEKGYLRANAQQQADFERLLTYDDPTLFAWLMGKAEPNAQEDRGIVAYIRESNCAV